MSAGSILGLAGSYFFGPVGGFIGSTLGGLLDRPEDIVNYGPRIQDRKVTTTGYGQAIPIIYGTMQTAAHIIEPKDFALTETVHETEEGGGKGGPSITNISYTYSATFAMMLCEGPIIGVRKIWLDSNLVYDFSADATAEAIIASNNSAIGIRIYTGTETQEADSVLDSINGAGNTPAYRGYAYIVFDAMQLEKYGNRVPNIRAEVVASGSTTIGWGLSEHVDHEQNYDGMVITSYDNGVFRIWDKVETTTGTVGTIYLVDANGNYLGSEPVDPIAERILGQDNYPIDVAGKYEVGTLGSAENTYFVYADNIHNLPSPAGSFYLSIEQYGGIGGNSIIKDIAATLDQTRYVVGVSISADHRRMLVLMGEVGVNSASSSASGIWYMFNEDGDLLDTGTCDYSAKNAGAGIGLNSIGLGNSSAANLYRANMLESNYTHLWTGHSSGGREADYWILDDSGVFSLGDEDITALDNIDAFDTLSIYADGGVMMAIGDYDTDPSKGFVATFTREGLFTTSTAVLSDIVDDIENRAGVTSANRDNSALTDTVDGYMIARQTVARRAIEPLQTAYFFDTIETGYKLKSIQRGGSSVATIDITDMGAREHGSDPVYPLNKTRMQEIELPIEVVCQYISPPRGYEVGTQRSRRIITQSSEKKNIDLPISMSDDKGKQITEVLHFNFWSERNVYSFTLMPKYTYLDPSDIITITDGSDIHTVRITSMNMTPGGVIQCEGVADRPALYSSDSIGVDNDADAVTVTEIGPTKAVYGDWPMFTNGYNDQAIYIAAAGYLSGWSGAVIYRSLDTGASYLQTAVATRAATIGYTTDVLADGDYSTFDYASTVNVNLLSGTLSSSTKLAVLNGANAIMIGAELIQFVTATLESDGTYTLSTLLRGRKGTEWAMSDHAIGENAVLLDTTIQRPQATLNVERQYKAVSIGNFLADSTPENVTYTGVNLKPFAALQVEGSRVSGGDLTIDWIPRSRFETAPLWSPVIGEDSEEYEIDIYTDGTYTTIKRAITGLASPTYTYTAALQTTDFGSTQATVYVKIYQKSAIIGRGYAASEAA